MTTPAIRRYAAGSTVYGNGTTHPTDGTVDPSGYIDRELNKVMQPSQTRSGLAAAALSRINGGQSASYSGNPGNSQPGAAGGYSDPSATPSNQPVAAVGDFQINAIGQLIPVAQTPALGDAPNGLGGSTGTPGPDPALLQGALAKLGINQ